MHCAELALRANFGHWLVKMVTAGAIAGSTKVHAVVKLCKAPMAASEQKVDLQAHGGRGVGLASL